MTTEKNTQVKKIEEQRFEFVFYVNRNIVCQRYFHIYDYNEDFTKSIELKDMLDNIGGMNNGEQGLIPNYLKNKSMDYLWDNYNPYELQSEDSYKAPAKKGDVFKFEFRVDKRTVGEIQFDNEFFTLNPKINVDIREIIPAIISEIRQATNQKNYTLIKNL
jgi:hypothetical protein